MRFVAGHHARNRERSPIADRFWAKVDKGAADACWEWTGARFSAGYGALSRDRASGPAYAHRLSWELNRGVIPLGAHVLHRCDNPPCVNPAHLFLGDHADNMLDRTVKQRSRGARGEAHRSSRLTRDQVRAIRESSTGERGEQPTLARQYGVSAATISQIINRQTWAWLP